MHTPTNTHVICDGAVVDAVLFATAPSTQFESDPSFPSNRERKSEADKHHVMSHQPCVFIARWSGLLLLHHISSCAAVGLRIWHFITLHGSTMNMHVHRI